jgi:hypothetical protein
LGVKKQPLALKRSQPADAEAVLPSQNPDGVWLQKKLLNILAKRLTTLGRVDTLIKRQKRSGSLNRQLKAKN